MANITADTQLNLDKIRADFPILKSQVHGKSLVYFDNAASSQRPKQVIDRVSQYYSLEHSNVHRGVHYLSDTATTQFEAVRMQVQSFINAAQPEEIIFTKGTTDGINLVAYAFGERYIQAGDEILLSQMEHHSNIVPWQMLAERKGAVIKVIPINQDGELILEEYERLLSNKTKLVAITHVSNALGTVNDVKLICQLAGKKGAFTLIDGAQAAPHMAVDVQDLNCDFYVFSGHKMCAPTGTGVLYGKKELLNEMPPYQGGGDMIKTVSFEKTTYNTLPHKFEAGTPNIAGVIGLGQALNYLNEIGLGQIAKHEHQLMEYATSALLNHFDNIKIVGNAKSKTALVSFLVGEIHPYDIGTLLDKMGIAVRTGHHCTQPLMDFYKIPGTVRASFAFYNTFEEVDYFVNSLKRAVRMFD